MKITIYHTNDIHSSFMNMTKIAHFLKVRRTASDLVFDCGDLCDLKSLMIQGTEGKGAVRLLKAMHYDALCIGNNEIDIGKNKLANLSFEGLPLISCNVYDETEKDIGNIQKSIIIERAGFRFLVIGVSPYYSVKMKENAYNQFFLMGNIQTTEPISAIKREIEKYRGQYDFCILLSHCGWLIDKVFLEKIKEIDLCLGGHSHTLVQEGRYSQAGKYGEHIGAVELTIEKGQVTEMSMHMENNDFESDHELLEIWQEEEKRADQALSKELYTIPKLNYDAIKESELVNFICDALYAQYPCDFAFMNAGIVNSSIEGVISKKKLIELSPSKLNPTRFPVLEVNIRKAIEQSMDSSFVMQDGRGSGFRGKLLGTLGFSANVKINKQTMEIYINGKPLDDHRVYDCMAHDYLQRGSGYACLKTDDSQAVFYDGFIRDLLERHLSNPKLFEQAKIKRIKE